MEVIVFHPDYTNSDFVGQILPKAEGDQVTYEFVPGPFTRIMRKANDTPELSFFLMIEEINRGNAPAIFGEIFQLLDRDETGQSEYSITHPDIARIVYNGDASRPIRIPSNLSIIATMNTSDQNVFTLDTAFQRRWHMRIIPNDVSKAEHANDSILDTGVTWLTFCTRVNNMILDNNLGMVSSEDKRLGAYFVLPKDIKFDSSGTEEAKIHNRLFAEKVIKYLWDDAFKFRREALFDPRYRSLEQVLMDFQSKHGFSRFDVFSKGTFTKADVATSSDTTTQDTLTEASETVPQDNTEQQGD
jgi:5-methylcytosine-specific restriction endonuclease McrBC GTP-binding regulatory subunit McrB